MTKFINFSLTLCLAGLFPAFGFSQLELSFNHELTNKAIQLPHVSTEVNNANGFVQHDGFYINVLYNNKPLDASTYTVEVQTNQQAIPNNNVVVNKAKGLAHITVNPTQVGITQASITVTYKGISEQLAFTCAASEMSNDVYQYYTGISDASAAIQLTDSLMLIADDETNGLYTYPIYMGGLYTAMDNYNSKISLPDTRAEEIKETDIEAVAKQGNSVYWFGSMSNGGKKMDEKPNRSAIIKTSIQQQKPTDYTSLLSLKKYILKSAAQFNLELPKNAASGTSPKQIDGFNVEGACFMPNSNNLLLGFRAPLVKVDTAYCALVYVINEFEAWYNKNNKSAPIFSTPLLWHLNKRGIRDMFILPNNHICIVAGGYENETNNALYDWDGNNTHQPTLIAELKQKHIESGFALMKGSAYTQQLILITDDGSKDIYGSAMKNKSLHPHYKKFTSILFPYTIKQ